VWATTSDARLKKNVCPLVGALERVSRLRGVTFEWIEPEKHGNQRGPQLGMIAQEVEAVFPEWVGTDADGSKYLSLRGFEAVTIESVKELKAENDALRDEVRRLRAEMAGLRDLKREVGELKESFAAGRPSGSSRRVAGRQ
jgi:uncharacterized small protein (DUF1192 family)